MVPGLGVKREEGKYYDCLPTLYEVLNCHGDFHLNLIRWGHLIVKDKEIEVQKV